MGDGAEECFFGSEALAAGARGGGSVVLESYYGEMGLPKPAFRTA